MMRSKRMTLVSAIVGAGALVTGSVVVLAQDAKRGDSTGERTMDAEAYQTEVARLKASLGPQMDVLTAHQKPEEFRNLPPSELGASYGQASSLRAAFESAPFVVVVTLSEVRFEGSGLGDLPASVKTYVVTETLKGGAKVGDRLIERVVGGPYRQSDGKLVYVTLPRGIIEVPGDKLLLFLDDLGTAGVGNNDVSVRFTLDSQGRIAPSANSAELDLAGLTVAEALAASR